MNPKRPLILILLLVGVMGLVVLLSEPPAKFAPVFSASEFNLPDTIEGYKILAVLTPENHACMTPNSARVLLQPIEGVAAGDIRAVQQRLEAQERADVTQWNIAIVGPAATIEQIRTGTARWNTSFGDGNCVKLGPAPSPQPSNAASLY